MLSARAAKVGARGVDTITPLTAASATALKASGIDFVVRYLHSVTKSELFAIAGAGLAGMLVCYADRFDGPDTVAQLTALEYPAGCTVWCDLESDQDSAAEVTTRINTWANTVKSAGWDAGLYNGCNHHLDANALYHLTVDRYWRSASWVELPQCDYCVLQLRGASNIMLAGVLIDMDIIEQDKRGRVPTWAAAA